MKQRRKKAYCFNCNISLSKEDNFCRKCGQENHDKKASFKNLIDDFLGDYFTFDSKIWRSLKLLLFSPGKLTLLYSEGKITDYIRPIRLVLFSSIFFALLFSYTLDNSEPSATNSEFYSTGNVDVQEVYLNLVRTGESIDDYAEKKGRSHIEKLIIKGVLNIVASNKNIGNELLKQIGNMFLVLIPFYGFILMLAFWRDKKYYVEHFVHSLHIQSFFFFLFSIYVILSWFINYDFILLPVFSAAYFVYIYFSFKKFYKRSVLTTLWKLTSSSIMFSLLLIISFFLTVFVTISMY